MFRVPQVVCYYTPLPHIIGWLKRRVLSVRWVSLVNLVADREVVTELVAETFSVDRIRRELEAILPGGSRRQQMLDDYHEVHRRLVPPSSDGLGTAEHTANLMIKLLNK
jgi:lipid-A-disaccharide synthase